MHRILMVEEDEQEVDFLKTGFEQAKLQIEMIQAATASQVLHYLNSSMPSIIFLDLHLSTAYSWHIIEQIRQRPIYNDIPIVIYTGTEEASLIKEGYKTGADLVLKRSMSVTELSESLRTIFSSDWKFLKQQRMARKIGFKNC